MHTNTQTNFILYKQIHIKKTHKGTNQHLEKKRGKIKSEHAHKRHQHLKKSGKSMSEHAHKWLQQASEKKERETQVWACSQKAPQTGN